MKALLKQRRCGAVSWFVIGTWILWTALALSLGFGGLACSGADSNALAVEISSGGIRAGDLLGALESRASSGSEPERREILNEELERLVEEYLVAERANELGIVIPESEVQEWLLTLHGPEFENSSDYRDRIRRELAGRRAAAIDLADQIHINEDAVLRHFEDNREDFARPSRIQIRHIVVQDEAGARRILDELEAGTEFATLAERNSLAPEATDGGLLPPFAKGELPEVFDAAFELKLDEVSDVVQSSYGYHVFLLVARFAPEVPELGKVRDSIVAKLENERFTDLKRQWLRDLRRGADIRVNERLLQGLL